jgi:hypothetical protein
VEEHFGIMVMKINDVLQPIKYKDYTAMAVAIRDAGSFDNGAIEVTGGRLKHNGVFFQVEESQRASIYRALTESVEIGP